MYESEDERLTIENMRSILENNNTINEIDYDGYRISLELTNADEIEKILKQVSTSVWEIYDLCDKNIDIEIFYV